MSEQKRVAYPFKEVTDDDVLLALPFTRENDWFDFDSDHLVSLLAVSKLIAPDRSLLLTGYELVHFYRNVDRRDRNYTMFVKTLSNDRPDQNMAFWKIYDKKTGICPLSFVDITGLDVQNLICEAEECFIDFIGTPISDQACIVLLEQENSEFASFVLDEVFADNSERDVTKCKLTTLESAINDGIDVYEDEAYVFLAKTFNYCARTRLLFYIKYYRVFNSISW